MAKIYGSRWEVLRPLGEGGQAHTFLVRDMDSGESAEHEFVLKRLKNRKRLGRFEQEIQALRGIQSERIPPIVDHQVEPTPYIVTPYLGRTLADVVRSDNLSFDEAFDLFRDVVKAAVDAHGAGVVHRDIKPDNVVVDAAEPQRRAYLIDFGICQFDEGGVFQTTTDEPLGNRSFAAPEMELGANTEPSQKSDVYSLGKLLYWVVTGGRLFAREDLSEEAIARIPEPVGVERPYIRHFLRRTVCEEPKQRTDSGTLLRDVEMAGKLMRVGVNLVGAADQLCMVCRLGHLTRMGLNDFELMGLRRVGNPDEDLRILRCDFCGFVQHHFLPHTKGRDLWEV